VSATSPTEFERLATALLHLAEAAAVPILDIYRSDNLDVSYKSKDDPVTAADKLANAQIVEGLRVLCPGVPVVAEESESSSYGDYQHSAHAFFVDPIDGTKEFVSKTDAFCTMLGMTENGRPVVGVIYCPVQRVGYVGTPHSAYMVAADGSRQAIRVAAEVPLCSANAVISRVHRSTAVDATLARLGLASMQPFGSAGLKAMRVAAALANMYVHPTYAGKRWDACAPEAIVVAAGGVYTDAWGDPFDYRSDNIDNSRGVLVAAPALHALAVNALAMAKFE
jgi:3'(2'), 5'-bisphosphate nucleotidase